MTFYHFDSSGGANSGHAQNVMRRVLPYVKGPVGPMVSERCAQQENWYDCGIHVLCNAEFACLKYLKGDPVDVFDYVSRERVNGKRKWLNDLIISLRSGSE